MTRCRDSDGSHPLHHDPERLRAVLEEAIHDEYKARATYRQVIARFGPVRPFLPIPADDWERRVSVPDSLQEACRAGVQGEIENAALYDRLLQQSEAYPDVQRVLGNLRRASQQNHLRAFQRCAERQAGAGRGRRHRDGRGCPG